MNFIPYLSLSTKYTGLLFHCRLYIEKRRLHTFIERQQEQQQQLHNNRNLRFLLPVRKNKSHEQHEKLQLLKIIQKLKHFEETSPSSSFLFLFLGRQ